MGSEIFSVLLLQTSPSHSLVSDKMKFDYMFLLPVFLTLVAAQMEEKTNVTFVEGPPSEWEIPCEDRTDCPTHWECFEKYSLCVPPLFTFGDIEVLYSADRTALSQVDQSILTCSADQKCGPDQLCNELTGHCLQDLNTASVASPRGHVSAISGVSTLVNPGDPFCFCRRRKKIGERLYCLKPVCNRRFRCWCRS